MSFRFELLGLGGFQCRVDEFVRERQELFLFPFRRPLHFCVNGSVDLDRRGLGWLVGFHERDWLMTNGITFPIARLYLFS